MTGRNKLQKIIFVVFIFSVAMGFMETAIVVYLRDLYYPHGFGFPLVPISKFHSGVELLREAATIIMLIATGWLAGNTPARRFAFFLMAFAIWDLVYYIALKVVLDWPSTIMEWDILFLIPVPWFGPVLAPCIISTLMLVLSSVILIRPVLPGNKILTGADWLLLISGSLVVISSFVVEYIAYISSLIDKGISSENELFLSELSRFIPHNFNWILFVTGCLLIISSIIRILITHPGFSISQSHSVDSR